MAMVSASDINSLFSDLQAKYLARVGSSSTFNIPTVSQGAPCLPSVYSSYTATNGYVERQSVLDYTTKPISASAITLPSSGSKLLQRYKDAVGQFRDDIKNGFKCSGCVGICYGCSGKCGSGNCINVCVGSQACQAQSCGLVSGCGGKCYNYAGACTGSCYQGCSDGCYGCQDKCYGCSNKCFNCTGATITCVSGCWNKCKSDSCANGCSGLCSTSCSKTCGNACTTYYCSKSSCSGSCHNSTCTDTCRNTCSSNTCGNSCSGSCTISGCSTICTNKCKNGCGSGCTSTARIGG